MKNNIPYDLPPDDDTEEMTPREYRPLLNSTIPEFPDWSSLPEPLFLNQCDSITSGSMSGI